MSFSVFSSSYGRQGNMETLQLSGVLLEKFAYGHTLHLKMNKPTPTFFFRDLQMNDGLGIRRETSEPLYGHSSQPVLLLTISGVFKRSTVVEF